jgi:hypothetical protein
MQSRTVINLAYGVIMAQNRCSQAEAMEILTKVSSHRNRKLRDVATELSEQLPAIASRPTLKCERAGGNTSLNPANALPKSLKFEPLQLTQSPELSISEAIEILRYQEPVMPCAADHRVTDRPVPDERPGATRMNP